MAIAPQIASFAAGLPISPGQTGILCTGSGFLGVPGTVTLHENQNLTGASDVLTFTAWLGGQRVEGIAIPASPTVPPGARWVTVRTAANALSLPFPVTLEVMAETLLVNDAEHAQEAGQVAFTGKTSLAINDAQHTQEATQVQFAPDVAIAVASAEHAQEADQVSFGMFTNIAPDDAEHAQEAGTVAFTGNVALAVNDAEHAQESSSPTVSSGTPLEVQDAEHAQEADAVAFAVRGPLVPESAEHVQEAGVVAFTVAGPLNIDSAEHRQEADRPDVNVALSLIVNSAEHVQEATQAPVVADYQLTIADAEHAQETDVPSFSGAGVLQVEGAEHAQEVDEQPLSSRQTTAAALIGALQSQPMLLGAWTVNWKPYVGGELVQLWFENDNTVTLSGLQASDAPGVYLNFATCTLTLYDANGQIMGSPISGIYRAGSNGIYDFHIPHTMLPSTQANCRAVVTASAGVGRLGTWTADVDIIERESRAA